MQIIILFIILWRRTVPACIPLEDLSGSRLRLPARLWRVHWQTWVRCNTELMQMKRW